MPLSARKAAFVDQYLVDLNATAAAIRAGYAPKNANQAGYRLLQEPAVAAAIAVAQAERSRRTHVSADRVIRELARIAFSDVRKTVTWGPGGLVLRPSAEIDDDVAAAVSEVSESTQGRVRTLKVKLIDKLAALRLLADHTGVGAGSTDTEEDIGADEDPPVVPEAEGRS